MSNCSSFFLRNTNAWLQCSGPREVIKLLRVNLISLTNHICTLTLGEIFTGNIKMKKVYGQTKNSRQVQRMLNRNKKRYIWFCHQPLILPRAVNAFVKEFVTDTLRSGQATFTRKFVCFLISHDCVRRKYVSYLETKGSFKLVDPPFT